jgi:hypothetical protein
MADNASGRKGFVQRLQGEELADRSFSCDRSESPTRPVVFAGRFGNSEHFSRQNRLRRRPLRVVLEFKLPSRIIASKQSMTDRRRARRAFGLRRGERKYENMHVSP